MGTDVCSTCVNALNGTWLPLVKTSDDADGPPLKAPPDASSRGSSNRLARGGLRHRRAGGSEAHRVGRASRYQPGASGGSRRRADKQIT